MSQEAQDRLRSSWPWLCSEYNMLSDNMRELFVTLRDEGASGDEREKALISASQLLCRTLRACRERDLFQAIVDDVRSMPTGTRLALQRDVVEHLTRVLEIEEAILIAAGLSPAAARELREVITRIPSQTLNPGEFIDGSVEHYARLAAEEICHRFPKSSLDFKITNMRSALRTMTRKYGFVGAATVAAGNLTVSYLVPEPMAITKISKLLAMGLAIDSASDD